MKTQKTIKVKRESKVKTQALWTYGLFKMLREGVVLSKN